MAGAESVVVRNGSYQKVYITQELLRNKKA